TSSRACAETSSRWSTSRPGSKACASRSPCCARSRPERWCRLSDVEVLALVPARGGSKGLTRKNVLPLAGKPLVAHTIATALQAATITRTVVSTEDDEIAAVAREYGAEVPFMRPVELAGDESLDLEVFEHALSWLAREQGYEPELVVHLRPTCPVRRVERV